MAPGPTAGTPDTDTAHNPQFAIETVGLSKTYQAEKNEPPVEALKDVSLKIPRVLERSGGLSKSACKKY